jgi:hypothetical protein
VSVTLTPGWSSSTRLSKPWNCPAGHDPTRRFPDPADVRLHGPRRWKRGPEEVRGSSPGSPTRDLPAGEQVRAARCEQMFATICTCTKKK